MNQSEKFFFSELLQQLRNRKRLSQEHLAELIGVSREAVSLWERGYYKPGTDTILYELVRVLDLTEQEQRQLFEAYTVTALTVSFHNPPLTQNPYFTGRSPQLTKLHTLLIARKQVALTQAISGLGGVGKTQLALEYAYRYQKSYHDIFWAFADTYESLMASYIRLAALLHLPEYDEPDQSKVKPAVQHWLSKHTGWLLILDNIEDLSLVDQFIPIDRQGAVLLTTRQQATEPIAQALELGPLSESDGILFLLKRTKILALDLSLDAVPAYHIAEARAITQALGNLPLALDQAGAYILETRCTLPDYLELFQKYQADLLQRRAGREIPIDHPLSVTATFTLNFQRVQQRSKVAAELLRSLAFLHPDAIPEEVITRGASELGPVLRPVAHDLLKLNEAIAELLTYSLVRRDRTAQVLQVHRLVQAVLKDEMNKKAQRRWAERTVRAIERAFPDPTEFEMWKLCEQCLPHVLACANLIREWDIEFNEAARLLNDAGGYLNDHARYVEAEPLYQQALAIGEKTLGAEHPIVALRLSNLASLYTDQGKYKQAEPLYQRSLGIAEKTLEPKDPGLATTLNNLAILYRLQGKYEQAEPLLQRAIRIDEQALGLEHPGFAMDLNNLAALYLFQGRHEEAEPLLQRALEINEKALGREHPNIALNLNSLAIIYHKAGRHEEAEPLLQRALTIGEKALGANHPQVARYLDNYAVLLRETDRETEAAELQVRAQAIRAKHAQEN